jgi:hypothetical protein
MSNDNYKIPAKTAWWQPAIAMFLRLSAWIAGPVIIALYVGEWLDNKYGTKPWLFLTSIGVAFFVSMVGLVINTLKEFKKIESENKTKNLDYDNAKIKMQKSK